METTPRRFGSSWCVTRVVNGSVTEVARLLDQETGDRSVVTVNGGRLELPAASGRRDVPSLGGMRLRPGRLRYTRWRPAIRITLEVERWSDDAAELTIRPSRRPPHDAYYGVALEAVEVLAADVERRARAAAQPEVFAGPDVEHWRRAS